MKLSQLWTAPNQLTLLRMLFLPFIVISLVDDHYAIALILFVLAGISDGLDGLLARRLHQQTLLGQYLDPIADKLLLSTLFLVLSILHKIPWKYTVLVFGRDIAILVTSAVLYTIAGLRNFSPEHLRQGQHLRADCRRLLRDAVRDYPFSLGVDRAHCAAVGDFHFHCDLVGALRLPGADASEKFARSGVAKRTK